MAEIYYILGIILLVIFLSGLRVINQYQRAVKLIEKKSTSFRM